MTPSEDEVKAFAFKVWNYKQGEVVSLMVHLGDRLGLYRAMAARWREGEAVPMTAGQLAERTGLQERWVLEWLRSQAAAALVQTDDGEHFHLPPEAGAVLADEDSSVWFAAGAFQGGVLAPETVDRLADAFRTGRGLSYDDLGPAVAHGVERQLGPWTRLTLVPVILPALDGVVAKLRAGARVADVGCGAGVAVLAMAAAFPESRFAGYDPSELAIERARANQAAAGLPNAEFHAAPGEALDPTGSFDLVVTLDCLHDMPRPDRVAEAIRRSCRADATWLIKEIRSATRWSDNLKNPMLAFMYGTSVATCLSSALSEPGGAGLGTLGLPPERTEALCRDAGFTSFRRHAFDDPVNLYYEVRP